MTPEERKLKKALKELSLAVSRFLRLLDDTMTQPEGKARGQAIAKLSNDLEMANDLVRFFSLGVDYRRDSLSRKRKEAGLDA